MASVLEEAEGDAEGELALLTDGAHAPEEETDFDARVDQDCLGEAERVRFLATGYCLSGAPVGELCAHNAGVAAAAGDHQLSSAWEALEATLRNAPEAQPDAEADEPLAAEPAVTAENSESATPAPSGSADAEEDPPSVSAGGDLHLLTGGFGMDEAASREALLESVGPIVAALLHHHAERGDAQTCAVLARTLRPVVPHLVTPKRMQQWTLAYVAQLQRLQLFGLANAVIKWSDDERVSLLNQRSTTVNVGGGGASASQGRPARARCSVCQLPVRGVHVWCQGCGHGGHAYCLRAWFSRGVECPTGCGHVCLLRPTTCGQVGVR